MGSAPNGDTLKQYRTLLLKIVERMEDDLKGLRVDVTAVRTEDIPGIKVEIAEIRTEQRIKASIYGLFGGFIPAAGVFIYWWQQNQ